jgi:hypothetical protein
MPNILCVEYEFHGNEVVLHPQCVLYIIKTIAEQLMVYITQQHITVTLWGIYIYGVLDDICWENEMNVEQVFGKQDWGEDHLFIAVRDLK